MRIEPAPNIPAKPAIAETAISAPLTSTRAPPIAARPLPISSHCIAPNFTRAFARSSRPWITMRIPVAPNILENPDIFPAAIVTPVTSVSAPPIAARPLPISSHCISPNFFRASARSLKPWTRISMPRLPNIDLKPPNFCKMAIAATSSPKAPPIPTKPRAISPQESAPNFVNASPRILQASANAKIAILVLSGILTLSIILRPTQSSSNAPPRPSKPFAISSQESPDNFTSALLMIRTAVASRTSAMPTFIKPLGLNFDNALFIALKLMLSSASITPIANNPFATSSPSSLAMVFSDAERIPIAIAILTKEAILIPLVKDSNESCTEPRISLICSLIAPVFFLSKRPSNIPLILSTKLPSFLARTNIPPPARPAKISPAEIWSVIQPKTFVTAPHILEATVQMVSPMDENIPLNPPRLSNTPERTSEIPVATFERAPVMPSV